MTDPRVSVVLPTYNRAAVLARAMRSVLAQTFHDIELIVVDDGSTDDTARVVASFDDPRVVYIKSESRVGVAAARNMGVRHSRADLVAFQDSDDEWLIDKLSLQLRELDRGNAGLVCCSYLVCSRSGSVRLCKAPASASQGWHIGNITDFNFITPTWLARKVDLERVGLFDESLPNLEDWELSFRLVQSCSISSIAQPLVVKHGSDDSINPDRLSRAVSLQGILARHEHTWSRFPSIRARLYSELGGYQIALGEFRKARSNLRKAVALQPSRIRYWLKWWASYLGRGNFRRLLRVANR